MCCLGVQAGHFVRLWRLTNELTNDFHYWLIYWLLPRLFVWSIKQQKVVENDNKKDVFNLRNFFSNVSFTTWSRRKAEKTYIWAAWNRECLTFWLEKLLKCLIDYQISCQLALSHSSACLWAPPPCIVLREYRGDCTWTYSLKRRILWIKIRAETISW